MREYIKKNLMMSYDIIKYIHQLYIKYKKYINFTSFKSTGIGFDTIYNVFQIKNPDIFILNCKVLYSGSVTGCYILFPIKIITIFGMWTFIDDPSIIDMNHNITYIKQFMTELQNKLNLKFLFPGFYDLYDIIYHQMFIITQYDNYKCNISDKLNNLKIDINIYKYEIIKDKFLKFQEIFFNQYPYGPDIIEYEFNNFIKLLLKLKIIDDKQKYFYEYLSVKNNKILLDKYLYEIKNYFIKRKIFGFQKNVHTMLFYYTYFDYI
jgi:hypothetical protein